MAALNPKLKTILLLTGIVISIGVAVAVGYLFESQKIIWFTRGIVGILTVVFLGFLIRLGYGYEWTGFGKAELPKLEDGREIRPKKTVWDWLQLLSALAIPVVLAVAGLYIESQLDARQRQFEKNRVLEAQEIEKKRAEAEQELADQRAQDEALQAYLDQMNALIIEHNLLHCDIAENQCQEVRTLAEARTQTAVLRLDSDLNNHLIFFLQKIDVLGMAVDNPKTNVYKLQVLENAPLSGVDLARTGLANANLRISDLSGADLHEAELFEANLEEAKLFNADLSNAIMVKANLGGAFLDNADLSGADLSYAYVSSHLKDADLRNAVLTSLDLSTSDLRGADLRGAKLRNIKLMDARMMAAWEPASPFPEEPLGGADFRGADLSGAYKTTKDGSKHPITDADLEQQTQLLEGAIMPNGSKHP